MSYNKKKQDDDFIHWEVQMIFRDAQRKHNNGSGRHYTLLPEEIQAEVKELMSQGTVVNATYDKEGVNSYHEEEGVE